MSAFQPTLTKILSTLLNQPRLLLLTEDELTDKSGAVCGGG